MARRWNGWGDETVSTRIPGSALGLLEGLVGQGRPTPAALLADVVEAVPPRRLPAHRLLSADAEDRLRHARGQSLGDWIALRSGQLGVVPDAVGRPTSPGEVRELLRLAADAEARVVPYGGGTTVVGGLSPAALGPPHGGDPPVLVVAAGTVNRVGPTGPLIDPFAGAWSVVDLELVPGALLALYTDGLIEARDPDGQLFGPQRLDEILASHPDVDEAMEAIGNALGSFRGERLDDDLTVVLIQRI